MEYLNELRKIIEDGLNAQLTDEEMEYRPFCVYSDVGNFDYASRNINDIIGKKYGVLSLVGSNVSPLTTLKFAELTAQCEIIVNVDEMTADQSDQTFMYYAPVAAARKAIEDFISAYNGMSTSVTDTDEDKQPWKDSASPLHGNSNIRSGRCFVR